MGGGRYEADGSFGVPSPVVLSVLHYTQVGCDQGRDTAWELLPATQ